ncbi:MAG: hypothetical protein WA317_01465 [Mycobacterium sp.]|uniref:hypothetical protein n=1 Tax=Mycobacterium sp. TaxID=1785 RepID=UPI003CC68E54
MDPNANLEEQLRISRELIGIADWPEGESPAIGDVPALAVRLSELVIALDGWIARGCFPPAAWKQN